MLGKLNRYLTRISVFLITAALIAGMVGCGPTTRYNMTMAANPVGGGTATDLTNASPYAAGTEVSIKAVAGAGYYFVNWTAPAGTFANANAAQTTFTMPAQNVTVTANFAIAIEIRDWYDLDAVRNNLTASYTLMNDLDSTTDGYEELAGLTANWGAGWQPVGTDNDPFTGTLDGQGYEIRDLFINRLAEGYAGLFGYVDDGGIIKNVGVVNANVTGVLVGGLVGVNDGTVSNCYATGNITGYMCVGGLVGANGGTVSNCYSSGSVTLNYSYSVGFVGGLVGATLAFAYRFEQSIVSNSYYNYDEVLINGENIITIGALFDEDFDEWLANGKFLDVNDRLSQEDNYYLINDVSNFKQLLAFGQNATLKFRLTNDLDLSSEPNFYIPYLAGEFDGNGHKISNLSFNFSLVSQVGLFGYLAPGGNVTDLAAESVNITAGVCVGGLVGASWNSSTVSNCYSTGSVTGKVGVGGLVGANGGTVSDSYSTGSVIGEDSVGGLVGENGGTVSSSYATGRVGGDKHVGGLMGESVGPVSNSYSTGNVTGEDYVGGLVGLNTDYATVSDSYSTGSVNGSWDVGGLVGCNFEGSVSNSYSTGNVTGLNEVGGLVGRNGYGGNVSGSFWDIETSGQATSAGGTGKNTTEMQDILTFSGAGWSIIAVALNETNPAYIWNIVDNVTYPFLSWQP